MRKRHTWVTYSLEEIKNEALMIICRYTSYNVISVNVIVIQDYKQLTNNTTSFHLILFELRSTIYYSQCSNYRGDGGLSPPLPIGIPGTITALLKLLTP